MLSGLPMFVVGPRNPRVLGEQLDGFSHRKSGSKKLDKKLNKKLNKKLKENHKRKINSMRTSFFLDCLLLNAAAVAGGTAAEAATDTMILDIDICGPSET